MKWRFIHIPKNAGTSVREAIGQGTEEGHPHLPASQFPEDVFTFAVIRHPLDRAVSICAHILGGLFPEITPSIFQEWVLSGCPTVVTRNGCKVVAAGYVVDSLKLKITEPQVTWLRNSTRLILFSFLREGLREICRTLDIPFKVPPHRNPGKRSPDWRAYYTLEIDAKVRDFFEADFAYFSSCLGSSEWYDYWTLPVSFQTEEGSCTSSGKPLPIPAGSGPILLRPKEDLEELHPPK